MKIFKKLLTLCAAITLAFGVTASLAACDSKENSSSSTSTATPVDTKVAYEFELKFDDGSPATGYQIQICTEDNTICLTPVAVSADGKASVTIPEQHQDKEFVIHVMLNNAQLSATQFRVDTTGVTPIPVGYDGDAIQITILD